MAEQSRDGWSQRKFTMDDLLRHATSGRVANVMRPYIEAITAGRGSAGGLVEARDVCQKCQGEHSFPIHQAGCVALHVRGPNLGYT